jgi:hypothetical protein
VEEAVSDPWQDPTTKAWIEHVVDEMVPKLKSSAVVVSIVPGTAELDVKFCVELGATIMLEKPLIITVFGDRPVPPKLEALADEVVRLPEGIDPAGSRALAEALERVLPQRKR